MWYFNTFSFTKQSKPLRKKWAAAEEMGLSCLCKGSSVTVSPTGSSQEWLPSNFKICHKAAKNLKYSPATTCIPRDQDPAFLLLFLQSSSDICLHHMMLSLWACFTLKVRLYGQLSAMNRPELGRAEAAPLGRHGLVAGEVSGKQPEFVQVRMREASLL